VAGRLTGVVTGVLTLAMLAVAGCQGQPVQTVGVPAAGKPPAGVSHPEAAQSEQSSPVSESPVHAPSGVAPASIAPTPALPEVQPAGEKAGPAQAEATGPAVDLTLTFVPEQAATYRITTELQKTVEWKGAQAARPDRFTDGRTGNHIELTFAQRVEQVEDDGDATLQITIQALKYAGEVVNKVVLDFDSARPEDAGSPLAALIGRGYQVRISPQGEVREISGVEPVRQAVQGILPAHRVAQRLLSDEEIRSRHEIAALAALKDRPAHPGQTWSSLRTFSFDDLGAKTYERIYTLGPVIEGRASVSGSQAPAADRQPPADNLPGRTAVVEMKAIPSAARAEELHQGSPANPFAQMSDNTDSYTGRLLLDLDRGQVREYREQMQNEWIIADPRSVQTGRPTAIKMAVRRLHRLEIVP